MDVILLLGVLCGSMADYRSPEQCYTKRVDDSIVVLYHSKCHYVNIKTGELTDIKPANYLPFRGKMDCK